MQNRGLKTLILITALVPSLLIAFALGAYLSINRLHDLDELLQERGRAAATQLANAARQALLTHDNAALQELSALALEERGVDAMSIFNAQRERLVHAGPQIRDWSTAELSAQPTDRRSGEAVRFAQPILRSSHFTALLTRGAIGEEQPIIGWVVVEYSRESYLIEGYQSLFIGGLIILLALVGATAIAVFASRRLDSAVTVLRQGVQRIETGDFDAPIHLLNQSELQELAHDINRMAEKVQSAAIDLRRNLEQTNRDLRESLETVEVQNIELDLARREALEASRIKSEFLANTSHELRTPLNGIIGFTKLLLKGLLDTRQREYLETIRYSAENLLTIINDILDFSKIEAGKLILENAPFNLRDLIEETLTILAPSAAEKKLQLILLYDNDVPAELVGDPLRIRQILTNLISNGIKFTRSGHIAVRVALTGHTNAKVPLKISISDTGIGLSEAQQKQLFKAFAQADASTSREFGGTGLGLVISKRLVEQMGGEIGLSSQVGHGSTFWFSLRLQAQQNPLRARRFEQLAGKHLLLCDAQPLSQLAWRQLLESWQIDVTIVSNWQALRNDPPTSDGWLLAFGYEHPAFSELPASDLPIWILLPGPIVEPPQNPSIKLLPQPVGHVQLYDALCDVFCHRSTAAPTLPTPRRSERPQQVLAVDDNVTNLKLLAVLLEELGAITTLAGGGRQALEYCDRQRFDLILLDIQMPELNGAEVARLIRQGNSDNRTTRIVALTAHLLPEEQRDLLADGFDLCLTKPITEEQLQQLLTSDIQRAIAPSNTSGDFSQPVQLQLCLQRARNKADLAKEFLEDLLHDLAFTRNSIRARLASGDNPGLLQEIHKLHGACCYSGVPRLQKCSHRVEELLKQNSDRHVLSIAIDEMLAAIDELLVWKDQHDIEVLFEDSADLKLSF